MSIHNNGLMNLTGDWRWHAPQSPLNATGVRQATTVPAECYQSGAGMSLTEPAHHKRQTSSTPITSEDCLFLK